MKTLQDAANKIARHLFKQKACSTNGVSCRYRVEKSGRLANRCAVGCLIEKKHYSSALGNKGAWAVEVKAAIRESGYETNGEAVNFYSEAQRIHDSDWHNRNAAFKQLCTNCNLEYNPS